MAIEIARPYIATINITASLTNTDIFECVNAAGKPVMILGWEFGQLSEVGDAQEEWIDLVLSYYTTLGTTGTGGSTVTARPTTPNSTAFGGVVKTGNMTTKYTGGTAVEIARFPWNVRQTSLYIPFVEERFVADASKAFVLTMAAAAADAIVGIKGRLVLGELI
jgi:hypothetical protein